MHKKERYALISGLFVSVALLLAACGRADSAQAPVLTQLPALAAQPTAQAPTNAAAPTPIPSVAATEDGTQAIPPPTPDARVATVTQAAPPPLPTERATTVTQAVTPRGFADAAAPSRTLQPAPAGACPDGCVTPPQGCLIKGTLPRADYKVFLLPGQPGYAAAQIDTQKGERWFCTIAEARAAGWLPAKSPLPARAPGP